MSTPAAATLAERLVRRRTRLMPVLSIFFVIQQAAYFSHPDGGRLVDKVRMGGWVAMSAVILLLVTTGGFWFRARKVRQVLEDESTRAHRASALSLGFVVSMLTAILLNVLQGALGSSAAEVLHLVVSAGLVTALLRFTFLEWRALA
jgi:uncharacterized membrane protein